MANKITRRSFVQASALTLGVAAVAEPTMRAFAATDSSTPPAESTGKWISSTCQGCTSWCAVQVYVEDGRVIKVKGNPNSKANRGFICPRPHLAIQQLYDPDRLKGPMKRTNPKKGRDEDPQFVPISWDEALDTVAEKMMELRDANETHKLLLLRGRYTGNTDILYKALPEIFGSANHFSHSSICAEAEKLGAGTTEGFWDYRDFDVANTEYFIMWGADPIASNRQTANIINRFGNMKDNATIIVVDPRLSATAAKGDEWLPVIPGQDGALALAIAQVILSEDLWNKEFVGDFTDGANHFSSGTQVDETLFQEKYTHGVAAWWNLTVYDKTPEWAEAECGIPAEQIRRVARGFAAAGSRAISWMTPGVAMQVRGAYGAMAANALNGLVGSIESEGGPSRTNKAPVGKIPDHKPYQDDIAKTGVKQKKFDKCGDLEFAGVYKGELHKMAITNRVADCLLDEGPYEAKMVIASWNNWVYSCTGAQRWEEALAKVPFLVHITLNPAEMTQFADIVLPARHQMFERWGFVTNKQDMHSYVSLEQPSIEPVWDTLTDETEIPWRLAEKLSEKGFSNMLDYFTNEFADPETGVKPTNSKEFDLHVTKMLTEPIWNPVVEKKGDALTGWDEFLDKGIWNAARTGYRKHWDDFGTKTGKFEFYSETLKAFLEEHAADHNTSIDAVLKAMKYEARGELAFVPHFEQAYRHGDPNEYPYIFSEHRSRLNREGRSANTSWYQEFKDVDPGDEAWEDVMKINPVDCKTLGVKTGDGVRVTSVQGSIVVRVKEWEGTRPGVVVKCYGQGHWAYGTIATKDYATKTPRGGNNNEIIPADWEHISSATARHGGLARVKIEKVEEA
ncbi:MAG: molybdopterin-dependent oxidoreductase [Gordonibacter sp.]|nr:molybdopterin-dependent oxidoreductase [Gordonibacter sp.]